MPVARSIWRIDRPSSFSCRITLLRSNFDHDATSYASLPPVVTKRNVPFVTTVTHK
jgi:hypothetical protein